jgi:hypothetical protein
MIITRFPRTLPFGSVIPLICADIKRSVDQFYSFAINESGQPVVPQVDIIVQNVIIKNTKRERELNILIYIVSYCI